jgi:DNA primase
MWSPELADRVIVPFFYQGRIVGYTARKITPKGVKYLSDHHPHFVFNVDNQKEHQQYMFVCEGPLDAIAVGGVALLTNAVAEQQYRIINNLGHQVIVIPDQDRAGLELIDRAIERGWSVAFPNWDPDVKDAADAVARYGRLFVTVDCILTAQQGEIKITMARKQLEAKIKRWEYDKTN